MNRLERAFVKLNETTRNVGIGVFAVAYILGAHAVATGAAFAVMIDQLTLEMVRKAESKPQAP